MFVPVAHAERVSVGKVIGDVSRIRKRNVRPLPHKTNVVAVIAPAAMWEQTDSGFPATADDGE